MFATLFASLLLIAIDQAQSGSRLHVLKIASGPAGTETAGNFVLTEERSIFSRSSDREVIVFFQWDGLPGPHKFVGQWRSPDGALTSTSNIEYTARDNRFGAYWRLAITPSMPLGTWTIEATVDGQPAGRHTFEIREENVAVAPTKRPLTPAELYERLNHLFVVLERSTADGQQLEPAGAFLGSTGLVYTSLSAVDATDVVRAVSADGVRVPLPSIVGMSRAHDWAVLAGGPAHDRSVPVAAQDAVRIGDRCFSIEGASAGGRVIAEGSVSGQSEVSGAGRRLLASFPTTSGTPGAPVMNEYGELIGVIAGSGMAGATRLMDLLRFRAELKGTPIVPFTAIRVQPTASGESLAELQRKGQLVAPLSGAEHVLSGGFARAIQKGTATPVDQRDQFFITDKNFVVFVTWRPQQRLRGMVRFRVHDANNRVVMESKPDKADYRKERLINTHWQVPVPGAPGLYRFDVLFDEKPAWRGFVRLID